MTQEVATTEEREHLLGRAYRYLSIRMRSEAEMGVYLRRVGPKYGATDADIEWTLSRLKEQNYLNDARFSEALIHARTRGKARSVRTISHELKHTFGISDDVVSHALHEASPDDEALALQTLRGFWSKNTAVDAITRKRRALQFLLRRGFSYDHAHRAIRTLEENEALSP